MIFDFTKSYNTSVFNLSNITVFSYKILHIQVFYVFCKVFHIRAFYLKLSNTSIFFNISGLTFLVSYNIFQIRVFFVSFKLLQIWMFYVAYKIFQILILFYTFKYACFYILRKSFKCDAFVSCKIFPIRKFFFRFVQ